MPGEGFEPFPHTPGFSCLLNEATPFMLPSGVYIHPSGVWPIELFYTSFYIRYYRVLRLWGNLVVYE